MKGLDLRKFKKVSSDKHTTTLQHPDGHKISIAHRGLKGELKKQLDALPAMADGGMVENKKSQNEVGFDCTPRPDRGWGAVICKSDGGMVQHFEDGGKVKSLGEQYAQLSDEEKTGGQFPEASPRQWTAEELTQIGQAGSQIAGAVSKDLGMPQEPVAPMLENVNLGAEQPPMQTQQPSNAMQGVQSPEDIMRQSMNQYEAGVRGEAAAQGALGRQQAELYNKRASEMETLNKNTAAELARITDEGNAIISDMKNGHIDPKRFWNEKSNMGKAAGAIGLILGGLTSGYSGGKNPALEHLNALIDRDIDAQKADMQNKNNILHALNQQFGNTKDAAIMAKALYTEIYSDKIAAEAAKFADPIAKSRAQQLIAQWHKPVAMEMAQMAMRRAVLEGVKGGGVSIETAIPHLVPEPMQKQAFEEAGKYAEMAKTVSGLVGAMNQVAKLQSAGSRIGSMAQSKSQIEALNSRIDFLAKDLAGRVSDKEMEVLRGSHIGFMDSPSTIQVKIRNLQGMVEDKANYPVLKGYIKEMPAPKAPPAPTAGQFKHK